MTTPITDMVLATAAVDRPEHENLFVGDEVDNYLRMASANHMTGNSWYSTECCAALGHANAETFQDAIIRMHRSFVGGITKLVYHVYPYRDSATSKWPGHHNFGPAGFSNEWGPRNPFWVDARDYNDYLARNQQVLIFDTFTVTMNCHAVAVDQLSAESDIYLKAGENTIVARVATTLNNRLAKIDTDVANRGLIQPYGLVGPVRLTPYSTASVWSARR